MFQGPKWRTEPSDLILPYNSPDQQAVIKCEAEGAPSPQYRWSLNGTLIDLRSDYRRHMSGGNLIISGLDRDQDTGIYQCMASNKWGSLLSHKASLQFAYLENFKTQTVRSAVNVREGQGVVLLCGPPTHSGGKIYPTLHTVHVVFVADFCIGSLMSTPTLSSKTLVGLYPRRPGVCILPKLNLLTWATIPALSTIPSPERKSLSLPTPLVLRNDGVMGEYEPKIEVHFPESIPAAKGSMVKLNASLWKARVPEISWRRTSGVPFPPGKVKMRNSNAVLEIVNFSKRTPGPMSVWRRTAEARTRTWPPLFPRQTPLASDYNGHCAVDRGEPCSGSAKPTGSLRPSYSWLKDGETLASEVGCRWRTGAVGLSPQPFGRGMYQCVAENKHGVIYSSAELMVLEPLGGSAEKQSGYGSMISLKFPLNFLSQLLGCGKGSKSKILFLTSSPTTPKLPGHWYCSNLLQARSGTALLKKNSLNPTLPSNYSPISKLTFLSKALEKYGVCVIDTALNWFPSYFSNRSFLVNLGNCSSPPASFSCGVPQGLILGPILAQDVLQLNESKTEVVLFGPSDSTKYILSNPMLKTSGYFDSALKFDKQAVLKALSGSQVSLDCLPQASPPASSLWKKGNDILQKTDRINLLPNAALRIANVTKRDSASYTCVARNQFGSASTTGRLLITEPTRITLRPTNMEIIVGESIVLPCQMACDPALDVSFSWAFNGQLIDFQRDGEHFERVGGVSGLK
ncbi:Contactin-3 [Merluccius polli]|uniref:Contactin-3 n=1 Tax=Merluccius polli TaxID=89951 RepID=A0AA47MBB0_MERPO|nr:Contactin-3 [Merluccius polli]